jgi:hypothetical protein
MQPPVIDHKGRSQRAPANRPDESVQWGEFGPTLERLPVAPTDDQAQADLELDLRRANKPGGKRARQRRLLTQRALILRAANWDLNDIAAHLGVATSTLTRWFTQHKRGVDAAEIDAQLDQIALPLATENLIHGLLAGDKDYTLDTLKGRGKFRKHSDVDGPVDRTLPTLEIKFTIEQPVGGAHPSQLPAGVPSSDSLLAGGRILGVMALPKQVGSATLASRGMDFKSSTGALSEADGERVPAEVGLGTARTGEPGEGSAGSSGS